MSDAELGKVNGRVKKKKGRGKKEVDEPVQTEERSKTPVLELLGGPNVAQCSPGVLVDRIMTSIRTRVASNPGTILLGRTHGHFRINYDPDATNVTSIKSRVRKLVPSQDDYMSIERLLCPLVATNKKTFAEIKPKQLATKPMSWSRRTEAVAAAVEAMRARCKEVDPESLLLLSPKDVAEKNGIDDKLFTDEEDGRDGNEVVMEWSLFDMENGFATKVKACFDDPALRPAEYEDLVERVLYSFKRANPSAIYGPPGTAEVKHG
ncbi:hypothetical protein LTR37_015644 [Vermiconidia calcicola]|uniref:Uncharacterized protein n=1 Tax=Vermiconidia calcicola TaxID=1690605 RepID=A0ACC3MQ78_9PEZI|nr:hypothetical protein LTR37_015644 [Vermiconidia calcicola]